MQLGTICNLIRSFFGHLMVITRTICPKSMKSLPKIELNMCAKTHKTQHSLLHHRIRTERIPSSPRRKETISIQFCLCSPQLEIVGEDVRYEFLYVFFLFSYFLHKAWLEPILAIFPYNLVIQSWNVIICYVHTYDQMTKWPKTVLVYTKMVFGHSLYSFSTLLKWKIEFGDGERTRHELY